MSETAKPAGRIKQTIKITNGAVDCYGCEEVEIVMSKDKKCVWVNVNGVCMLRAQGIKQLFSATVQSPKRTQILIKNDEDEDEEEEDAESTLQSIADSLTQSEKRLESVYNQSSTPSRSIHLGTAWDLVKATIKQIKKALGSKG